MVQDPGLHGTRVTTGLPVYMRVGAHPLYAMYGENGGGNQMQIRYSGPDTGGSTVVIPQSALCNRQFSGPLPVELTAFTARAEGRQVRLNWRTASELNNDHFDVERSRDGRVFEKIGEVSGHGTTSAAHEYSFSDAHTAKVGVEAVYYRLRQVDVDGSSDFSPVRALYFAAGQDGTLSFRLYPNPAQQRVVVELTGASKVDAGSTITLTDLAGRTVLKRAGVPGTSSTTLELRELPTGVYLVQVEQNGRRYTQRLVHTGN